MTFNNSTKTGSALTCPKCGAGLDEVRAGMHYGRSAVVDKCGVCAGVWFDKWELYSLTEAGLRSLLDVGGYTDDGLHEGGAGLCPRCSIALVSFNDPGLPKEVNIKRCDGCSGAWLDRADIERYSRYKENVLSVKTMQFKETETGAIIEYEKRWLGKAKSTPLDRTDAARPADGSVTPDGTGSFHDGASGANDTDAGDCGGDLGGDGGSCD